MRRAARHSGATPFACEFVLETPKRREGVVDLPFRVGGDDRFTVRVDIESGDAAKGVDEHDLGGVDRFTDAVSGVAIESSLEFRAIDVSIKWKGHCLSP
jgi:hypothetical protein